MFCITGLGNPEPKYSISRHNIGFQIADRIAEQQGVSFKKGKGEFLEGKCTIAGKKVLLIKPLTYMNRSGIAVRQAANFYKVPLDNFLIIMDDLDLPFGTFRFRPGGTDGGNKGLRSIIGETGINDVKRFRFGIRNRNTISNASSYVLSNFTLKERKTLDQLIDHAIDAVESLLLYGIDRTMNDYNRHFEF